MGLLNKYDTVLFWSTCVVVALLQVQFGLQHFYWDAERYWESGRELMPNGVFGFENHVTPRGVLYPLINCGLIQLFAWLSWHEITAFKVLNSIFVVWGSWKIIPAFWDKVVNMQLDTWQRMALTGLIQLFWFRYFSIPLTDYFCLVLLLWGFVLLWESKPEWWRFVVVGCICGFIFNTRPIYNLLLGIFPLFLMLKSDAGMLKRLLYSVVIVVCSLVISIPQFIVNRKVWKVNTFFQPTEQYYQGPSLYLSQLKWGLYVQKYETFVGDTACYPSAQVFYYHDKAHYKDWIAEVNAIQTYQDYAAYLITHPVRLISLFRNVFNGIDKQQNTPYIYSLIPNPVFAFFNYLVWFLGICFLFLFRGRIFVNAMALIPLAYIVFTAVLCFPIAIEERFLLSLYVGMYLLVIVFAPEAWQRFKSNPKSAIPLIALFGLWLWMCYTVSAQSFAQLEHAVGC